MTLYMGTTTVDVSKTVGEIQRVLALYGATAILLDYADREVDGLSFKIQVGEMPLSFRLPCRWRAVFQKISRERRRIRNEDLLMDQAKRIAWRQILRWVQAQLSMVDTGMVKTEEVFMQYMMVGKGEKTLFEHVQEGGWKMKQLTAGDGRE